MNEWDSEQYLKFKAQRTQPAIDLASRIGRRTFSNAVDIGCGPGNSTAVLKSFFPGTAILGIDSSENMIEKARANYPELAFQICGACDIDSGYDLIFSNACLQWLPDHERLLPELITKLTKGGVLAVQIPNNGEEPLFRIIREIAQTPKWDFRNVLFETNEALTPDQYIDILSDCSREFDLWETVYYHRLPSHQSLLEWVRGTRLRPYLSVLDKENAVLFEQEILRRAEKVYPIRKNGGVLLRFKRLFFTAVRD